MYDICILGQVSKDINIDFDGYTIEETGGAVIYSGFAASAMGHKTAVLPKGNMRSAEAGALFEGAENVDVYPLFSPTGTSIRNRYLSADKERRISEAISRIEPYRPEEIPGLPTRIFHIAGLMRGDLGDDIIEHLCGKARLALDVQGVLRCADGESMIYRDWEEKYRYLPCIDFLKTDAAEAEVMTGCRDRTEAAKKLSDMGAKEIMITHSSEVLICRDGKLCRYPLKPRGLRGRSGRGDTCFSVYITERLTHGVEEALLTAAAAVSLKMETPGPFTGSRADVERYIRDFY